MLRHGLIAVALVATFAVTAVGPTAVAEHDTSDCEIGEAPGEVITVPGAGGEEDVYINVRPDAPGGVAGKAWVYQESNDVDGLQAGGSNDVVVASYTDSHGASETERCGHAPDTLIL